MSAALGFARERFVELGQFVAECVNADQRVVTPSTGRVPTLPPRELLHPTLGLAQAGEPQVVELVADQHSAGGSLDIELTIQ